MINVTNRPDIHVRFRAYDFLLGHFYLPTLFLV
jgi:hypothetical protein